jgi:DNA-directed RNA polymerase subunit H (RpoH/RPB5)
MATTLLFWVMDKLACMMQYRGYRDIQPEIPLKINKKLYGLVTAQYDDPRTSETKQINCIVVKGKDTFSKKDAMVYIQASTEKLHTIVLAQTMGPYTTAFMAENEAVTTYEHIKYDDIVSMKPGHVLVPIYTLMSEKDVVQLEKKNGGRAKFPKLIHPADAMVRYLGMQVGDVYTVTEKDSIHDKSYRLVVAC